MSWTTPADLRARLRKMWDRGDLLTSLAGLGEDRHLFPLRLPLTGPTSAEMTARFEDVRAWIRELHTMPLCTVQTREVRHRILGSNMLPRAVLIDRVEDAIRLIGKTGDATRFTDLAGRTSALPALLPWLARRPLRALELADNWPLLLTFVAWLQAHPRPGIFLRQVDLPGIHTKFIEAHRGVLAELLDLALPPEAIVREATGVSQFARRYGFRDKPLRVRFRILDPACSLLPAPGIQDMTLDSEALARVHPDVHTVFITENEINFLAFPPVAGSMIMFGGGYGFDMLRDQQWLEGITVYYWGDIDTHGFAILDELRAHCPHARSLLMDRNTLMACVPQWGHEDKQSLRDLPRLTDEETALYNDLRDNRIRTNLRLEQERIGFGLLCQALTALTVTEGGAAPTNRPSPESDQAGPHAE